MYPHQLNILPFNILKELITETITGQDELIDAVIVTIYRHLLKIAGVNTGNLNNYATNLLIIGKTGTGKTFTVKEVAKAVGIPFIEIDASDIAPGSSWKGASLLEMIDERFKEIEHEESRNYPIILIDEFDKMCMPDEQSHALRIQASILKIIEGTTIDIRQVKYDTRNFCFIFAGAFTELFKEEQQNIGFSLNKTEDKIITNELEKFGVMPELAGRINTIVKSNDFTTEMYYKLVCSPQAPVNLWIKYLKSLGVNSIQELNAVALVAEAEKRKLGGRGMNQLLEKEINAILLANIDKIDLSKAWNEQFPGYKKFNKNLDELG